MSRDIDYAAVEIPEDTPREEYHYTHRRAEILDYIKEHGTPAAVNRRDHAEKYDVSPSTIQNDMDELSAYLSESAGGTRAVATAVTVYETAARELMADGEYMKAVRATDSWMSWLQDTGRQHAEPERHEVGGPADFDPPKMSEKNREHFDKLTSMAEEQIAGCTVRHDGHADPDATRDDAEANGESATTPGGERR